MRRPAIVSSAVGFARGLAPLALLVACLAGACKQSVPPETGPAPAAASAPAASVAPAAPPETGSLAGGPDDAGQAPAVPGVDVATGRRGAVTTAEPNATAVGRAILEKGGNAVDAAVAIGLALGVTHPTAGGIGGGGFMVIYFPDGRSTAIDFREVAPRKASRDMYLDESGNPTKDSLYGPRAAGVAGNVAGFAMVHKKYGSLPWKELVQPAVALAKDGHEIDSVHAEDLTAGVKLMEDYRKEVEAANKNPAKAAILAALDQTMAIMRRPDGRPWRAGDRWAQPDLAATYQAIAERGAPAFYRGPLAKKLASEVRKMGGLWTEADLAAYRPIERKPIVFDYRGHQVITMPPPSAGGVSLRQIFAASEALELYQMPWDSVDRIHLYVEVLRRVYADRNQLIGDPAFVKMPLKTLLDSAYMKRRVSDVNRQQATPSAKVSAGVEVEEKPETTHFSVVDEKGMVVANTYTLNGGFGALVAVPGTGILLNNQMDDFTAKVGAPNMFGLVQGPQNAIAPGKRMVSSMTPTIVTKAGKLRAVCGSPGGATIITTVAQVLLQVIDYGKPIDRAIVQTRIHHQWLPDAVIYEEGLDPKIAKGLEARGHKLMSRGRIGHANCIESDPKTGELRAVADSARRGGDADAF